MKKSAIIVSLLLLISALSGFSGPKTSQTVTDMHTRQHVPAGIYMWNIKF